MYRLMHMLRRFDMIIFRFLFHGTQCKGAYEND